MNAKNLALAVLTVVIALGAFWFVQDSEYRKLHGTVTQVSLFNWNQEVEDARSDKPVLVYFYSDKSVAANPAQEAIISEFAWDNAGDVKVVSADCSKLDNLTLAIAHGALRYPAFVVLYKGQAIKGTTGSIATKADLERLIALAVGKK